MEEDEYTENIFGDFDEDNDGAMELNTSAEYEEKDGRVIFTYRESILTGINESVMRIYFEKENPGVVFMIRTGMINNTFVFEEGRCHTSFYESVVRPVEVSAYSLKVENKIILPSGDDNIVLPRGEILLDAIIDVHGISAQRSRYHLKIK